MKAFDSEVRSKILRFAGIVLSAVLICLALPATDALAAKLPAKYRTANLPEVRNQGSYGCCWAFATVSAMEAELITNNGYDSDLDLSELQMAYFSYHFLPDQLGQMKYKVWNDPDTEWLLGGSERLALIRMATGIGPVYESEAPYDSLDYLTVLDSSYAYKGEFHIEKFVTLDTFDRAEIKQAVMDYGAVAISYYSAGNMQQWLNEDTWGYYCTLDNSLPDHSVTIVGWDDSYSKNNFKDTPAGNGAWIVRNSWGKEWGDDGYFYLSYYDENVDDRAYAVDVEPGEAADNCYAYAFHSDDIGTLVDGEMKPSNGVRNERVANIFTAHGNEGGCEKLTGVSFCTAEEGQYSVWVYTGLTDPLNPESGTLAYSSQGQIDQAGYLSFKLDKSIWLCEGELFSVVVSCKNSKGNYCGVVKSSSGEYVGYGESFSSVRINGKIAYDENSTSLGYDYLIYAFTDDCAKKAKDATALKLNASKLTIKAAGEKAKLTATLTPVNSNTEITWKSSNSKVAAVDAAGNITGVAAGSCTITCTAGSLTASCSVTVKSLTAADDYLLSLNASVKDWPQVSGLKVSNITAGSAKLTWDMDEDAATYFVLRRNTEACCWEYIANVNDDYYVISGLSKNTDYIYGIVAARKKDESNYSMMSLRYKPASVSFKTSDQEATQAEASATADSVTLTWNKISGATVYKIYRMSFESNYEWTLVKSVKKSSKLTFTDNDVAAGETYMYRVYALKSKKVLTKGIPVTVICE